jgi:hypothetical protein
MNELVFLVTWLGNFLGWWMAARLLYRRWRPGGAHQLTHDDSASRYDTDIQSWAPGWVVIASMLVAVAWPLVMLAITVVAGQPPTTEELKARARAAEKLLAARQKELETAERELGVATAQMTEAVSDVTVSKKRNRREWRDPLSERVWYD